MASSLVSHSTFSVVFSWACVTEISVGSTSLYLFCNLMHVCAWLNMWPSATHGLLGTGVQMCLRARQSWVWILSLLPIIFLTLSKSLHVSESLLSYLWNGQLIFPAHGLVMKSKRNSICKGQNTVPTTEQIVNKW